MRILDLDLSEFEDPAPPQTLGEERELPSTSDRKPKKRKLPYRSDIQLSSAKYKGKRASRQDVELDTETLGINEQHLQTSQQIDPLVAEDSDEDHEETDEEISDDHLSPDEVQSLKQTDNEEQVVLQRLRNVEREEEARANGVIKQKELYDAVVNFRIRLELLMSSARLFPDKEKRVNNSSKWHQSEIEEELETAQSVLKELEEQTRASWESTCTGTVDTQSDASFEKWRDSVLDHWGSKINDASGVVPKGGFKSFDTSITSQMKASLSSGKHLNRTRRLKQPLDLLGNIELPEGSHEMHFDDGEMYRMLLREIIESGDGSAGGLRYAQLSKSAKVKKKAERGFAKGKRIKYDVHDKLVGFLAPIPLPEPGPLDEIIASLFGRRGKVETQQ